VIYTEFIEEFDRFFFLIFIADTARIVLPALAVTVIFYQVPIKYNSWILVLGI
jgi:hypothetical protein